MKSKCTVMFVLLCLWAGGAFSSPLTTLESASNKVLSALKKNKANLKTDRNFVYSVVRKHIIPLVDVYGMSRSVLGRSAWSKSNKSERVKFTKAFTGLVVRTYSGALRDYTDEKVKFYPVRGGFNHKRFVTVSSVILRSSGKDIPMKYSMVRKKRGWRVYDLSVEGVSLLQSYRSQFRNFLKTGTMSELTKKINKR